MTNDPSVAEHLERDGQRLDQACARLARASRFAKFTHTAEVLEAARRVLRHPEGAAAVYERIDALTEAGIFDGSDWATPELLQPEMAANTLKLATDPTLILECLSELRLLAVMEGMAPRERVDEAQARDFLARVLALNVAIVFGEAGEAERARQARDGDLVRYHQRFLLERVGFDAVIGELITEIWRILQQRPIQLDQVKTMISNVASYLNSDEPVVPAASTRGAERLISALFGPTPVSGDDPGLEPYEQRLAALDEAGLRGEALAFGRAMQDTGLVSAYHAVFLHFVLANDPDLVPAALGLSSTGSEVLRAYQELVHCLIEEAITPDTADAVYGLAGLLERGVLYHGPVPAALWRQIHLTLCPAAEALLVPTLRANGPPARVRLLAGVVSILGRPLGIGQGNNPTCQSARALTMWSINDPVYLLQIVAWAARDNDVIMEFEGRTLQSSKLDEAGTRAPLADVDAVSAVTVPHLDQLYIAMGRQCVGRSEDFHKWVNPAFHGWWVGRGFAIVVDVASGQLRDFDGFVRRFYACYHPHHNGNNPVIHSQPAGIAVTDASARFIGWHAISIERVGVDPQGEIRLYFFNPNNDSAQDWGHGVKVSTEGCGEFPGESSLPFEAFVSRLYIFHYDPRDEGREADVPSETVERIGNMVAASWGINR